MTRTPAEDRARWERTADHLLLSVRPFATPRHALVQLPGLPSANGTWSDGLEGFARTFLLAGFRLRGAGGADPHGFATWYAEGLAAGTDPSGPERWPTFEENNQAKVEAASIALALHETRPWIWDRLEDGVRQRVLDWLGRMVGTDMPGNNWIWFQAVTEAFARTAGGAWSREDLERTVALTDDWYAGGGWYSDGLTGGQHRNFDHYNGWAMHLYPLWFCRILGDAAPAGLLDRYRGRLRRFLEDQRLLVGGNGSPLIQGRSLTYRTAALAPVWSGALFDATPLPPGETRALAGRVLDHFTAHGAVDDRGLLTLGWHRPFRGLLQVYSGPASPYWASKGFIGLALPPGHPVWTARAEPLAVERQDAVRTLHGPGWLLSATALDGIVRVVNHGGDHADPAARHSDDPCYARFAYATHAAPEMPADPTDITVREAPGPFDNAVVLLDAAGRPSHRRPLTRLDVHGATGVSRSRAHWPESGTWDPFGGPPVPFAEGPWITVGSALRGPVEVRVVRVDPGPGDPAVPTWPLRVGGWALAVDGEPEPAPPAPGGGTARVDGHDGLVSLLTGARGLPYADVVTRRDANALGARSATPVVGTPGPVAYATAYVALVHLGGGGARPPGPPSVAVRPDGGDLVVEVAWPGGPRDTFRLPDPAGTATDHSRRSPHRA
ncbi:DUF2264 domain-containing protein [Streptomyces fuscigenes]|uniref:DUF2264 domain-containing protein n=1 Tax=Streptomyces fuscigenes TaxID=1528880 RepID=UPI001F46B280|nr:DUF2264 domain-containing protein [Streptomyces fuscigenes]MCF3963177.1 DUF2264 domain-containing protein [Streptomyces fuscigenes]